MKLNVKVEEIPFGSNIQTVEVPEILRIKVPTGLDYFDDALGGKGFTPSMVTLFIGTPGAGKTTMMLILANEIVKSGNIAIFNTAEESLHQIKMTSERLKLRAPFLVGAETHVPTLLKGCDKIREANPNKHFFLIVDSLQTLDDGYFNNGRITSATSERSLQILTNYAKEYACNVIVIGQVTKEGKMAGTQKLKHMVDAMMILDVERKDEELRGCRVFSTEKNRFGGCGHTFFLQLKEDGFDELGRISDAS
jgi:DNA repair protein RadA/Sms